MDTKDMTITTYTRNVGMSNFMTAIEKVVYKACPDNPKGLYPKGGGCKFCGSVEHLKADCTRKAQKDKIRYHY